MTDTKITPQYLDYKTIHVESLMYYYKTDQKYDPLDELDKQVNYYLQKGYILIGDCTSVPINTQDTKFQYVIKNYVKQTVALPNPQYNKKIDTL